MARHLDPKTTTIYFHNLNRLQGWAERFKGGGHNERVFKKQLFV